MRSYALFFSIASSNCPERERAAWIHAAMISPRMTAR
jgi:hypothetical protein